MLTVLCLCLKDSYKEGDKVVHRDDANGLWYMGTVVNVDGDRYEIRYFGGYRPNDWALADELLPQSALQDVSETYSRSNPSKMAIGARPIKMFDYDYTLGMAGSGRIYAWNRESIIGMHVCRHCGAIVQDFMNHYRTHHDRDDRLELSWSWYNPLKPKRLKLVKRVKTLHLPKAKKIKGWGELFLLSGYEPVILPQIPPVPRTPPKRKRKLPRRNLEFTPRSADGTKRPRYIMEEDDSEDAENDPLNTAMPTIYEDDFEDDPEAGPSNPDPSTPEPSNPRRIYPRTPAKLPKRNLYDDDDDDDDSS